MVIKENFKAYLKRPGISPSAFKAKANPHDVWYAMNNPLPDKPDYVVGRLFHTMLLEKHLLEKQFVVLQINDFPVKSLNARTGRPNMKFRSNKVKYEHFQIIADFDHMDVVWPDQVTMAEKAIAAMQTELSDQLGILLSEDGMIENTLLAVAVFDEYDLVEIKPMPHEGYQAGKNELLLKTRPDYFKPGSHLLDYKTSKEISPRNFARDAYNLGYDCQLAFGLDLIRAILPEEAIPDNNVYLLVSGKTEPYQSVLYHCPEYMITTGRARYQKRLQWINIGLKTNHWPGYSIFAEGSYDDIQAVELPFATFYQDNESYW